MLREVVKLEKFKDDTTETLGTSCWGVQQLSAAMAVALITCSRGEVGLQAWHAVTQWFKPRSVVEQAVSMAMLIKPKRTKNVN